MSGFTTKALHADKIAGEYFRKDIHGSLRTPVYDSVAFEFESSRDVQLAFEGKKNAPSYSRVSNPTVENFEQRVRLLADALGVMAVSSGMAAITNTIMSLAEAGSNIITTRSIFGHTLSLFEGTLKSWGLETRFVDMGDIDALERSVDSDTRAIFLEVITNPQLEVADIGKISEVAKKHTIPLIVDGTVTTPYLFKSKDFGVDIEIMSSTKYISGGATSVGGLIIDNGSYNWSKCPRLTDAAKKFGPFAFLMKLKREVFRNTGGCLSPHNAYLQTLGLETMSLRIGQSCRNSLAVAKYLEAHPKVKTVNYPGLKSSGFHKTALEQFGGRFGGILTFELENQAECYDFMDNLKIIRRATNLNDNKTLVIHPSSTIFCDFTDEQKKEWGISSSMIRLSVGIEDVEDIIEDIEQSFEGI